MVPTTAKLDFGNVPHEQMRRWLVDVLSYGFHVPIPGSFKIGQTTSRWQATCSETRLQWTVRTYITLKSIEGTGLGDHTHEAYLTISGCALEDTEYSLTDPQEATLWLNGIVDHIRGFLG